MPSRDGIKQSRLYRLDSVQSSKTNLEEARSAPICPDMKLDFYKEIQSMSQRHFIAASIGTRPHIALICLFLFIAGSQNVSAQSQIAQDAYAIFEGSCLICHGPDGAYRETLLMEHSELIDGGTVVPGNPNASELYKRLLGNTERWRTDAV